MIVKVKTTFTVIDDNETKVTRNVSITGNDFLVNKSIQESEAANPGFMQRLKELVEAL